MVEMKKKLKRRNNCGHKNETAIFFTKTLLHLRFLVINFLPCKV